MDVQSKTEPVPECALCVWLNGFDTLAMSEEAHRRFLMQMRDARLIEVDALERVLQMKPRTSEIRQSYKGG